VTTPTTNPPTSRGDSTREALIRAAIEVFGRDGFDAASTRAISEAAGVNLALIGYHFGGKPGLYLAALEFIAARVTARLGPLVESIEAALSAERGKRRDKRAAQNALTALMELLDAFVGMLASDESTAWARLILREQQNPSEGFDVLYRGFMHRVLGVTAELVARAQNRGRTAAECRLTAFTILGQAIVFRAARAAVMREMQWQALGSRELEIIKAQLRRNVAAIVAAESSS
jgi:TetR/AcrR family transcriptional regulator, regulator of cefoperazone and chloramphenicol sensitivity